MLTEKLFTALHIAESLAHGVAHTVVIIYVALQAGKHPFCLLYHLPTATWVQASTVPSHMYICIDGQSRTQLKVSARQPTILGGIRELTFFLYAD